MSLNNSGETKKRKLNGSSRTGGSEQGSLISDAIALLREAPPGTIIGSMISGEHVVKGDQVNRANTGTGPVIFHLGGNMTVGGKQTYDLCSSGCPKDPTTDTSIFNILCRPAESGCYELKNKSCALIINNIFNGNNSDAKYKKRYRKGAEGDTDKMRKLFNDLNFGPVLTKENVASDKLKGILERFRGEIKDEDYSSCFIIIMSHGGKAVNSILMDDLKVVDLYNDIVYEFSNHEDVKDRPKVFLVQACRSSRGPPAVSKKPDKLPALQDVLIAHSTSPNFAAGRNKKTGAVYFEAIDQVFRDKAQNSSLVSMLYEVYNHESLKKLNQYPSVALTGFRDYKFEL